MDELEARLHRTWVQLLYDGGRIDDSSAVADATISICYENFDFRSIAVNLPTDVAMRIANDGPFLDNLRKSLRVVAQGYITDQNNSQIDLSEEDIHFRVRLIEPEEGWQEKLFAGNGPPETAPRLSDENKS